jgi:aspartate-semialdehyde dehydrogenase
VEATRRYRAGILGATGLVGRSLVNRLARHPWFRITAVAASDRSAGRRYGEAAAPWSAPDGGEEVAGFVVRGCEPAELEDCDLVFSALDAATGGKVEGRFAEAGFPVVSNSSANRLRPEVPILVPEVNAGHLVLVDRQRRETGGGYIVTNPNCTAAGLVVALAPLHRACGVRRVVVVSLQAVSGAGAEGPRALDLLDNVIPWIAGEEEKVESETRKMLGVPEDGGIRLAGFEVSAHCHRVATVDGHLEAVSVELERPASAAEAAEMLRSFRGEVADLGLPSAPVPPIHLRSEVDRPQPRLDRDAGGGMAVVVGRIRPCPVLSLRLEILSHNLVRGAAGAAILNAELLAARGLISRRAGP